MRVIFWVFIGMLLTACAPFVDRRREAGTVLFVGESTPDRIAICYHPWRTTPGELASMAVEACGETGREAVFSHQDRLTCRALTPTRVFFDCKKR